MPYLVKKLNVQDLDRDKPMDENLTTQTNQSLMRKMTI
jgi:hypothetical protein